MAQIVRVFKIFPASNYAVVRWDTNGQYKWVACYSPWIKEEDGTERRPLSPDEEEDRLMYWGQGHYFQCAEDAFVHACTEEEIAVLRMMKEVNAVADRVNKKLDIISNRLKTLS